VQYWTGSAWTTVPGGSVSGNNKVWKKISFAPLTTSKIRVLITATVDGWSRVVEVEAWTGSPANINWLVADHLGTPRMIIDQTGTNVKRHDYLPFGEELFAPVGGRTTAQGYTAVDGIRQQFISKERDTETGLDYFGSRYYSSNLGRFTSPDSVAGSIVVPQTLNLYTYVQSNPLKFIDPTGHTAQDPQKPPDEPLDVERITVHDRFQQMIEQARKHLEESRNKLRDFWNLPSAANSPPLFCPTGNCQTRTFYDDASDALTIAEKLNSVNRKAMSFSDSIEVSGSAFYVISGGARITADGKVFLDFNTPLSSGLVDTFKDGFSLKEIKLKSLFSWSVTSTHMFGESNETTRTQFFGGGTWSAGGAFPAHPAVGPYAAGVYSPSSGQAGLQFGLAKPGVSGGYSWTPDKPTWHSELFRWKPK
jgi:RHS repeat-associated protein